MQTTLVIKYDRLYISMEANMSKKQIISGKYYKDDKGRDVLYLKSQNTGYVIQEKIIRPILFILIGMPSL